MKSAVKHNNNQGYSINDRLFKLSLRGEKHIKKGIQYDPHDLPKNALLRFCLFEQMKCPLMSVYRIDSVIFEFPIPSESVPVDILREVLIQASKMPNELVFIITTLNSSKRVAKHANLIVYNKSAKRIETFDPFGLDCDEFAEQTALQDSIIRDMIKYVDKDINYFPETLISGIQSYDKIINSKREGGGFCAIWTCFLAKLCVEFPSKSLRDIVEDITMSQQHRSTNICRGFLVEMREIAFDLMLNYSRIDDQRKSMRECKRQTKLSKLYLELREKPVTGKKKLEYQLSETLTMEYLRKFC